ncbi:hypothetical protein [Aquaspirillum soli]
MTDKNNLNEKEVGVVVSSFVIHARDWDSIEQAADLLRLEPMEFVKVAPYLLARRVIEIDDRMEQRIKDVLDLYR